MLLDTLVSASIQGGCVIAVLYLTLLAFPAISPLVRVWLWRFVFLKLAISLLPIGQIKLNILPQPEIPVPSSTAAIYDGNEAVVPDVAVVAAPIHRQSSEPPSPWMILWGTGVSLVGLHAIRRSRLCATTIRDANSGTSPALSRIVSELSLRAGLPVAPNVYTSSKIPSAMVIGSKTPVILLPLSVDGSDDAQLMVAHEIGHVLHRDLPWNVFRSSIQTLFFFHPLVWLASRAAHQAQETAADLAAIRLTDTPPKRYAEMLVRATVVRSSQTSSVMLGLPVAGTYSGLQGRLKAMKHFNRKPSLAKISLAAIITCATVAATPAYRLGLREVPSLESVGFKPDIDLNAAYKQSNQTDSTQASNYGQVVKSETQITKRKPGSRARASGSDRPAEARVDLNFKETDMATAVHLLTQRTGIQCVVKPSSRAFQRVTLKLDHVTGRDALRYICLAAGASVRRDANGVFIISMDSSEWDPRGRITGAPAWAPPASPQQGVPNGLPPGATPARPGQDALGALPPTWAGKGSGSLGVPPARPGQDALGAMPPGWAAKGSGSLGAPPARPGQDALGAMPPGWAAKGPGSLGAPPARPGQDALGAMPPGWAGKGSGLLVAPPAKPALGALGAMPPGWAGKGSGLLVAPPAKPALGALGAMPPGWAGKGSRLLVAPPARPALGALDVIPPTPAGRSLGMLGAPPAKIGLGALGAVPPHWPGKGLGALGAPPARPGLGALGVMPPNWAGQGLNEGTPIRGKQSGVGKGNSTGIQHRIKSKSGVGGNRSTGRVLRSGKGSVGRGGALGVGIGAAAGGFGGTLGGGEQTGIATAAGGIGGGSRAGGGGSGLGGGLGISKHNAGESGGSGSGGGAIGGSGSSTSTGGLGGGTAN